MVLLDLNIPGMDGPATARRLGVYHPGTQVLALRMLDNVEHIYQMLDAGATGYVLKNAELDEIVHGIRMVATGRPILCFGVGLAALHKPRDSPPAADAKKPDVLSKRETIALQLIADGPTPGLSRPAPNTLPSTSTPRWPASRSRRRALSSE